MIWVDENGENCIVITPGANNRLTSDYIMKVEESIGNAEMVVLQMEIPYETVKTVCSLAKKHKKKVILNVAPARELDEELLKFVDILVVNETEAASALCVTKMGAQPSVPTEKEVLGSLQKSESSYLIK